MKHAVSKIVRVLIAAVAAITAAWIAGCGGGGGGGGSTGLSLLLVDAPDPTVSAVRVTFDEIEAHLDGQWQTIPLKESPLTVSLLDLRTDPMQVAAISLPSGTYNQVRLGIVSCEVDDAQGTHPVTVPSGKIHLNVQSTIVPGQISEVLMDFNLEKSLNRLGNGSWHLQPVIPVVVKVLSGTVGGIATDGTIPLNNALVRAIYKAGSSYPIDTEVNSTYSMPDGAFKVWALLPGTYELQFSWTDGIATRSGVVSNVVVTANQHTDVGSVPLL